MSESQLLRTQFWPRIRDVDRSAWNACFADEAEDHAYYCACERASAQSLRMGALTVSDGATILAVAPLFHLTFSPGSAFQREGRWPGIARRIAAAIRLPTVVLGSPYAERCHIGLRAELCAPAQRETLRHLLRALEQYARGCRMSVLAVKDVVAVTRTALESVLREAGYVLLEGLPLAVLNLSGVRDVDGYLQRLSASTRKDLRRKQRNGGTVRIEERQDIRPLARHITALYESTRRASEADYGELEQLPPDYFVNISATLGARALFKLYWVGAELAAFNLLLLERDRVIDKFLGMRYPLAREHNVYALSWLENVRTCIARGASRLQTGQTAYRDKLRLGSELEPCTIYFRHRQPLLQLALRSLAPLVSFERNDPVLGAVVR